MATWNGGACRVVRGERKFGLCCCPWWRCRALKLPSRRRIAGQSSKLKGRATLT